MSSLYAQAYYPPRIQVALHGHVHNFQAINFASGQPAAIVSGNAGDNLDVALPDPFPAATQPAPGATIDRITHHSSDAVAFYNTRSTQPQNGTEATLSTTSRQLPDTTSTSIRSR